jgi:hypothetical protein
VKEYDLYVPVGLSPRKRLPLSQFNALKQQLTQQFGGLTYFPQKSKGVWRIGSATFYDEIVILRVLSNRPSTKFWSKLKNDLERAWNQKEILIVVRAVKLVR